MLLLGSVFEIDCPIVEGEDESRRRNDLPPIFGRAARLALL